MKYKFIVGVLDGNHIRYVTGIDNASRMAKWESGKPAKPFTARMTEDLVVGLVMNGFMAVNMKVPDFYTLVND